MPRIPLSHVLKHPAGIRGVLFALMALPIVVSAGPTEDLTYKEPVVVKASDILPKEILEGKGYTIHPEVAIHRTIGIYQLDTPFGPSTLHGTSQLLERINELKAIERLEEMKKTEVYKEAVKKGAKGPLRTAEGMLTAPVETVSDIGRGIGGFLSDIGYSIVSDNPYQDNVAKTAVGFATAKRQFAYELGVDPYTNYEPLQDALNKVAWTAVGGGLTVTAGFSAIGGTAGKVMSSTKTASSMKQLVRDNSPRDLKNINTEKLTAMGVEDSLADEFINNYSYDPENATRLIGALDSMEGVADRSEFFKRATLADTRDKAHLMREWAELLASYHNNIERVEGVALIGTAPFLRKADGSIISVFPADYVFWTPPIAERVQTMSKEAKEKGLKLGEMWLAGKVDAGAQGQLEAIGWKVKAMVGPMLLTEK